MATEEEEAFLRSLEAPRMARTARMVPRAKGPSGLGVQVGRAAGQTTPVNAGPVNFLVSFSGPGPGFVAGNVSFQGSTVGGTLSAVVTGGNKDYNVAVSGMTGTGSVMVTIPANSVIHPSGSPYPKSNTGVVQFSTAALSVTINKAANQPDPTSAGPIVFTVAFSQSVTGFTPSDVSFTGSTATGTLVAAVSGSGANYSVSVTGMTGSGNVVASIPAGAATDLAGNLNLASTSTDNVVGFNASMTVNVNITAAPYNCPTDGVTDCRPAFLKFKADYQNFPNPVTLTLPAPFTYTFAPNLGQNADYNIFEGIPNLTVEGTGATMKWGAGGGSFILGSMPPGLGAAGINGPSQTLLAATALAGATTIQLIPGDGVNYLPVSAYPVGRWVAIGAYDTMGFGSPPNPFYIEYVQIASVNVGANTITFATPLTQTYSTDFPLFNVGGEFEPHCGGPAMIWIMTAAWNCSLTMRGMTIDTQHQGQIYSRGRNIAFEDVIASSLVPSASKLVTYLRTTDDAIIEVDKMTEEVHITDSHIHGLAFQSAVPCTMIIDNSVVDNGIQGTPRRLIIQNGSNIAGIVPGCGFGRTDSITASDSAIGNMFMSNPDMVDTTRYVKSGDNITVHHIATSPVNWGAPGTVIRAGGSNASYPLFTVKANTDISIPPQIPARTTLIALEPNALLNIPDAVFNAGGFRIGSHVCPKVSITNCTGTGFGADMIADLSQTAAHNRPLFEYSKRTYNQTTPTAGWSDAGPYVWGKVVSIKVNVITPYAGPQNPAILQFTSQFANFPVMLIPQNTMSTYGGSVNLRVAGLRTITPSGVTNDQGVNGGIGGLSGDANLALPQANVWFGQAMGACYNANLSAAPFSATVEVILDQGIP